MRGLRGAWLVLVLAGSVLGVVPTAQASPPDYPTTCPFPSNMTYDWNGDSDDDWTLNDPLTNWVVPPGYTKREPNDRGDGPGDPQPSYVCIDPGVTVHVNPSHDFMIYVQALWLGAGATLDINEGTGVFVNSTTDTSYALSGSLIDVDQGWWGGTGTIRTDGAVVLHNTNTSVSALSSNYAPEGPAAHNGTLRLDGNGVLSVPGLGTNVSHGYQIDDRGRVELLTNGFLAVAHDAALTVQPGATFEINGLGGFYENPPDGLSPNVPSLVNHGGTILKSGAGTAVIGTDYEPDAGEVDVTGGTLAFAGDESFTADVASGNRVSTEQCAARQGNQPCVPETNRTIDPQAVTVQMPAGDGAVVTVHEDAPLAFTAHADALTSPALIAFDLGPTLIGTTHAADVQVDHLDDGQIVPDTLPPCPAVGLPAGATNCVDRVASTGNGSNVRVYVRTTDTSRYICRKEDATPPVILSGPTVPASKRLGRSIPVSIAVDEDATITVAGYIKAGHVKVRVSATRAAAANRTVTLTVHVNQHQKKKLRQARKGKAKLTVTAADAKGNITHGPSITVRLR
jgi:hypothetical protein